jgi:hypothetical protein
VVQGLCIFPGAWLLSVLIGFVGIKGIGATFRVQCNKVRNFSAKQY